VGLALRLATLLSHNYPNYSQTISLSPEFTSVYFGTLVVIFPGNVGIRKAQRHTWRCSPARSEVITRVSSAHYYPGFFRTGNLSRPRRQGQGEPQRRQT
jgi:hypothetical protein